MTLHEKEVSLKATHAQIVKHEKQINEIGSKKEFDALRVEISVDKARSQTLENEILEVMGKLEENSGKLPEAQKAVAQAKRESAEFEANSQSRHAGLTKEWTEAREQLKQVEATLSEDARAVYDRLSAANNDEALSVVNGRTCAACYTDITMQSFNDLLAGRLVLCKACGRMLYLPPQARLDEDE